MPNNHVEWVFNHAHFTATFKKRQYMAFTDGALRSMKGQELMSFIKVKKRMRIKDKDAILVQEGSEMVGWTLKQQSILPNLNNCCLMISQDRHEIHVIFASWHQDYLDYLDKAEGKGKTAPHNGDFWTLEYN